jgi:hypothetical protein
VVGREGWEAQLEANKQAYFEEFVERPAFTEAHPSGLTAEEFVGRLNANAGGALSAEESAALAARGAADAASVQWRAGALRAVAENAALRGAEYNRAFVLMQYFGYLRRDPDSAPDADFSGFNFWLTKLNEFGGNFIRAEMVKAFLSSTEYRQRFGNN